MPEINVCEERGQHMETVLQQADCASLCPCASPCPIGDALSLVGGKWKPRLICTLYVDGTQRFNDLLKKTRGITAAMLSTSLKELESGGIVDRRQYPTIPPRVEYRLTEKGRTLWPILHRLAHWANGEEFDGDDGPELTGARERKKGSKDEAAI